VRHYYLFVFRSALYWVDFLDGDLLAPARNSGILDFFGTARTEAWGQSQRSSIGFLRHCRSAYLFCFCRVALFATHHSTIGMVSSERWVVLSCPCRGVVSDWSMMYDGRFRRRHTCKYQGDFAAADQNSSLMHYLPSGFGNWMDDSHNGEVLAGAWKDGKPVAPFVSRRYGTGDAFRAVNIAYFMATDDDLSSNKLVPSNMMALLDAELPVWNAASRARFTITYQQPSQRTGHIL